MAVNLNGLTNQPSINKNERLQRNEAADKSTSGESVEKSTLADDTVQLSGAAQVLKEQEAKISQMPDIDMDKVEQIKQAIAAGEYKIDTEKLASNMMQMDALFS